MISFKTAYTQDQLKGILKLQKANLARNLPKEEVESQGFVTVDHSYEQLKKLNDLEKHVIAKDDYKVIGYLLAMTQESKFDLPVLFPMFNVFDEIVYKNKKVSQYKYLVVGQVCIDKGYRGQGILPNCYAAYKKYYSDKYDFAITEIATTNQRSLNAHKKAGFKEIYSYTGPDKTEWIVVLWDWNDLAA